MRPICMTDCVDQQLVDRVLMILQACLNGARLADFDPRLPLDLDAIVSAAVACIGAGASELHIHVRDRSGEESLSPDAVNETISAVRNALPGTLIGISTGGWIEGDDEKRLASISNWTKLPDYASVNLDEPGAIQVIEALLNRGVGIEAGLSTREDVARLVDSTVASRVLRILVEPGEEEELSAFVQADAVLTELERMPSKKPVLLHGFDSTVWPLFDRAVTGRYSTRVGLEDTKFLPDGTIAESNAELVATAFERLRSAIN
jgi:uncharacterized protein (DUF849 family)